jgi:hypothetical protein
MKKYFKYLWYIIKHKWYVFVECCKLGIPIRGLLHDLSKLRPDEFIPYAKYFYGEYGINYKREGAIGHTRNDIKNKECFENYEIAWLKHIHRNPHHWQYWILMKDSGITRMMDIPESIILEMVADWKGAGKAITGKDNTMEWYNRVKDKQQMSWKTRMLVEELLKHEK